MYKFSEPYRPSISLKELEQTWHAGESLVGGSSWSLKCERLMFEQYGFKDVILTTSCTDALEIAFSLLNLKDTDNVIVPGYTFVSSVLPVVNYTRDITFSDVSLETGMSTLADIKKCVKENTKVIVAVNYGGSNPELDKIRNYCNRKSIFLIEDAAQSIGAKSNHEWFGSFGDLATFSFHDTKNINSGGEGGCLIINNKTFVERAHILSEKGTNRRHFVNNKVDKYEWLDRGSSHVLSDLNAFFLFHGLADEQSVTKHRALLFSRYAKHFEEINLPYGPKIPSGITSNGHLIYVLLPNREKLIQFEEEMYAAGIKTARHYQNLAESPYAKANYEPCVLPNTNTLVETLCRLPIHHNMKLADVDHILSVINNWYYKEIEC